MRLRWLLGLIVCALALVALASGCGDDGATQAEVVFGITSDFRAGTDLDRLDVERRINGELIASEQLILGSAAGTVQFPTELSFQGVDVGAEIALTMRGYRGSFLTVVRHITTSVAFPDKRLVRVHLEQLCSLDFPLDGPGGPAPSCNEDTHTCISGKCQSAAVGQGRHEVYLPNWPETGNDACKPAAAGAPEVIVGSGQSDYFSVDDYDVAQVEAGAQGGHHIWVAARIRNLLQSGSITRIGGEIPELGLSISPLVVIFTLNTDEGGYCKIFGLRFQLDIDGDDVQTMLGKQLKLMVTVEDQTGAVGSGERWFTLSTDTI